MAEFYAAVMIPIALTRWEMAGFEDEIKGLYGGSLGQSDSYLN